MKEVRFFFVPEAESQTELPIDEAMHALRVLRLKSGDEMMLMDGAGRFFRAEVTVASAKRCLYRIQESLPQEKPWTGHLHLAIAPTKMMDRMEWMTEKATEVGFDELSFLSCRFSERKVLRVDRLEKIVVSAVKQSRKAWKPVVNPLVPFAEFVAKPRPGRKYIAHCYEEIASVDFFHAISATVENDDDASISVLVGPEGDFSRDEVETAMQYGYQPVSLGQSRLRTETAGLFAVMASQLVRRK